MGTRVFRLLSSAAADIFSLGTVLYEIFAKSIAAHDIAYTGAPEEFQIYAMRVRLGYRVVCFPACSHILRHTIVDTIGLSVQFKCCPQVFLLYSSLLSCMEHPHVWHEAPF